MSKKTRFPVQGAPTSQLGLENECWEYGRKSDHNQNYHAVQNSYDTFRRRQWVRKVVRVNEYDTR